MSNPPSVAPLGERAVVCRPATTPELSPALALILGTTGRSAPASQIAEFVQFAAQRAIDLNALWIVQVGGQMVWSALPVVSPGRTMLLFAPPAVPDLPAASQLVTQLCDDYAHRGIHLAQVLIDPEHADARRFFFAHGFAEIAELIYLQLQVPRSSKLPPLAPPRQWVAYSAATHALFADAILQTYRDSLDCPALAGVRAIEDVIAGHKATGQHDPALWQLLVEDERPLGVLLLSRIPATDTMELVYFGLSLEARGRGIGSLLMRQAMHLIVADNRRKLTLAVDSNNAPALKLYYSHGMQRLGSRIAMIRDLRPTQ